MDFLNIFTNHVLLIPILAWGIAQVLKTIINAITNRKFEISRIVGDGGMPSGHSATVTSMAMLCALVYGTGSFQFAISLVLAIIVCHDAMGVRRETGKQAVMLNELTRLFGILSSEELPEIKLKEFVGHTPVQVAAGITVGVVNAVIMYHILPGM